MALRDVLASFTVNVDSKGLDQAEKQFGKVMGAAQKFGAFLVAGFAGNAAVDFVRSQVDMADKLGDTSEALGIASDDLERWQYVAQMGGSSGEAMAKSMGFLNKALGAAEEGGKGALGVFAKLGVETKNADGSARELGDVLPDIVNNWNNLESQGEKTTAAMALFGKAGAELIPMLNAGGEAAADAIAEFEALGGATPAEFIKQSAEVNDQIDRMHFAMRKLSVQIVSYLLPSFKWLLSQTTKAISSFKKFEQETGFVRRGMMILAAGAVAFLIKKFYTLAKEAGTTAKALKSIFGIGPQGMLILAALAVLYVLFDDLFTLIEGGDSVIGELLDKFLGVGASTKYVQMLRDAWEDVRSSLADVGIDVGSVGEFLMKLGEVGVMAFAGMVQAIAGVVQMLAALVKGAIAAAKILGKVVSIDGDTKLSELDLSKEVGDLSGAGDSIMKGIGNIWGGNKTAFAGLSAFGKQPEGSVSVAPSAVPGAPPGWTAVPAGDTTVTQTNHVSNTFNGVGEKVEGAIDNAMNDVLKKQLKDAKAALKGK